MPSLWGYIFEKIVLFVSGRIGMIMEKEFDIQDYMTRGVERVVADAIKATLKDPKESAFMLGFAAASAKA